MAGLARGRGNAARHAASLMFVALARFATAQRTGHLPVNVGETAATPNDGSWTVPPGFSAAAADAGPGLVYTPPGPGSWGRLDATDTIMIHQTLLPVGKQAGSVVAWEVRSGVPPLPAQLPVGGGCTLGGPVGWLQRRGGRDGALASGHARLAAAARPSALPTRRRLGWCATAAARRVPLTTPSSTTRSSAATSPSCATAAASALGARPFAPVSERRRQSVGERHAATPHLTPLCVPCAQRTSSPREATL